LATAYFADSDQLDVRAKAMAELQKLDELAKPGVPLIEGNAINRLPADGCVPNDNFRQITA